jgi:biopolymer transport protein ExbD
MKFPRNAKLLRSPFDVAPFAAVFFLLVIFVLFGTLLPVPGLPLQLPKFNVGGPADDLPGTDKPTVAVAIDSNGRLFFSSQIVTEGQLKTNLLHVAAASRTPLTLVIQADQSVSYGEFMRVALIARDAGIYNALLAAQPHIVSAPNQP